MGRKPWIIFIIICLAAYLVPAKTALGDNQAGLIVQHGDGRVQQCLVSFDEPAISGTELLKRSGLSTSIVAGQAGEAVYMIDGEGKADGWVIEGGKTYYWNYYRLESNNWRYSSIGAGQTQVKDGDIEGWLWQAAGQGGALPEIRAQDLGISGAGTASAKKPVTSKDDTAGGNLASYLVFGVIAGALMAVITIAMVRNRSR